MRPKITRRRALVGIGGLLALGAISGGDVDESPGDSNDTAPSAGGSDGGSAGGGSDSSDKSSGSTDDTTSGGDDSDGSSTSTDFVMMLESVYSCDVESYEEDGGWGYLTVTSCSYGTTDVLITEMAEVGSVYAEYTQVGDPPSNGIRVTVLGASGNEAGTYHVRTEWASAYAEGEISAEEFSRRILETVEANE